MTEDELKKEVEPDHYKLWSDMKSFELHEKLLTKGELIGFYKGNILKYQMRVGRKKTASVESDLAKIKIYSQKLMELNKPIEDLPF